MHFKNIDCMCFVTVTLKSNILGKFNNFCAHLLQNYNAGLKKN